MYRSTLQDIKHYLIENEGQKIIIEQENTGVLTNSTRTKMISHLCEYIFKKFGPYPEKNVKSSVSKAAIKLFPGLRYKMSRSDGIVSIHIECNLNTF